MKFNKKYAKLLGRLTTRDEAGTHFTQIYDPDWLQDAESRNFIQITRSVHEPTGIAYGQEEWTVEVTPFGIAMGETLNWGE